MGEIVWTTDGQQLWVGDGLTQGGSPVVGPNVVGYGLSYDGTTRRIEVAGLSADDITNGVNNKFFATELAQDAAASLFVTGTHTNISFVYDDELGKINATVALDGIGLTDIVADTTPQLGGDLDLNSNDIIGTGNVIIDGTISNGSLDIFNSTFTSDDPVVINSLGNSLLRLVTVTNGETNAWLDISAVRDGFDSPTTLLAGDPIGGIRINGWDGSGYKGAMAMFASFNNNADLGDEFPSATVNLAVGNGAVPTIYVFNNTGHFVVPATITPGVHADDVARNIAITDPTAGMMIFNVALQKFQGYVSDTGLASSGISNETPGWINLNSSHSLTVTFTFF
jgi:hypothetical protein